MPSDVDLDIVNATEDIAAAWAERTLWIHRRVDTCEFRDADTLRLISSFDITIPPRSTGAGQLQIIPLACLKKGDLSAGFDAYDEKGTSLWRVRREESRNLSGLILTRFAQQVVRAQSQRELQTVSPELLRRLVHIAEYPLSDVSGEARWRDLNACRWNLSNDEFAALFSTDRNHSAVLFRELIALFSEGYLLCFRVPRSANGRMIIRVCSDIEFQEKAPERDSSGRMRRFIRRLGWADWPVDISASVADACSYHCEIRVPEGICLRSIDIEPRRAEQGRPALTSIPRTHIKPACAHLAVSHYRQGINFSIKAQIRVLSGGWLTSALSSSMATAALLGFAWKDLAPVLTTKSNHPEDSHTDVRFFAGTLFLAAAATMIAILVKDNEHQLTSMLIRFLRMITSFQILLAFAAVVLLVFSRSRDLMTTAFMSLFLASCFFLVVLAVAYVRSGSWWLPSRQT